jgi:hypothetical protein
MGFRAALAAARRSLDFARDDGGARRSNRLADLLAGAVAGIPAGIAYLIVEGIDNRISGRRLYDLQLLGRPFVRSLGRANVLGLAIHLGNSIALGGVYGTVAEQRLPGSPVVKGIMFVTIENSVLYPALAFERFHPARAADDMGSYWSLRSWLWTMPRHFAYGVVIAVGFDRLRHGRNERPERS